MQSSHLDRFVLDHLPPSDEQPEYLFELPELQFGEKLNCATELLDRHIAAGNGERVCVRAPGVTWTYRELQANANRIANVLVHEMGVVPGNRVLLRAPNSPMLAASWFAVIKAGAIAVATMPLLRAKELKSVIRIARVSHALCDATLAGELQLAAADGGGLADVRLFNGVGTDSLEVAMARSTDRFDNVATIATDPCILGFTSGTTGVPKATVHFHRDVMAVCACWPREILRARADDVFIGSPPLAFTFGLGGLLLFPLSIGASTVLLEKAGSAQLLEGIAQFRATVLFTAPTSYRALAAHGSELRTSTLRKCVSAGEALPAATRALWKQATGIELIDGIGATEMLHIFISADEEHARPGATGVAVRGYRAEVVDEKGQVLPAGQVGQLRVKGPTGCRYLADSRQRSYVRDGWNYTGDAYLLDADGYFHYQARTDDMIISAGYNIAPSEVEDALLMHPDVAECGVIGVPDEERGQIAKALVVLRPGAPAGEEQVRALQEFVKQTVAPYKTPRAISFVTHLPRTETGKLQRFLLRESEK